MYYNNDTDIAAISTANGVSAIAIVRVSGSNAWSIAVKIFRENLNDTNRQPELVSHKATHGYIIDENKSVIDEVVIVPYKGPNSYTGFDLVEINCHGNSSITNKILELLLKNGARLAKRGEFTQQAFLNGKLDLIQAEAVLDLIQAKTVRSSTACLSIIKGHLGDNIKEIRQKLIDILTQIIARIDFPDEVEDLDTSDLHSAISLIKQDLAKLAKTATTGIFLRQGIKVAIVGNPNVGKSSLLNQLLNFERAIVSAKAGTTRDFIEEPLDLNGIPVILVDTAGIRHTSDEIELIGIDRSIKAINQADLVLLMNDLTSDEKIDSQLIDHLNDKNIILLNNKTDLKPSNTNHKINDLKFIDILNISAKTGLGIDKLIKTIENFINNASCVSDVGGSLNQRQGYLCNLCIESLDRAIIAIQENLPLDCLTTDLKEALDNLSQICGIEVSQEIITNVFANFCVGK